MLTKEELEFAKEIMLSIMNTDKGYRITDYDEDEFEEKAKAFLKRLI